MEVARLARNQKAQTQFVGEHCSCGTFIFPPRDVCPECRTNLGPFNPNKGLALVRELDEEAKKRPPVEGAEKYWLAILNTIIAGQRE